MSKTILLFGFILLLTSLFNLSSKNLVLKGYMQRRSLRFLQMSSLGLLMTNILIALVLVLTFGISSVEIIPIGISLVLVFFTGIVEEIKPLVLHKKQLILGLSVLILTCSLFGLDFKYFNSFYPLLIALGLLGFMVVYNFALKLSRSISYFMAIQLILLISLTVYFVIEQNWLLVLLNLMVISFYVFYLFVVKWRHVKGFYLNSKSEPLLTNFIVLMNVLFVIKDCI